jgi:tRNA A37 threonylcarbamoyladenosine biosynthesis protein TsaE
MGLAAAVKSPTFTLVHEYRAPRGADGRRPPGLAHLDLYRIPEGRDVSDLALEELLEFDAVAVEWGGRLAAGHPDHVRLELSSPAPDPDERVIEFAGYGPRGRALVDALAADLAAAAPGPAAGAAPGAAPDVPSRAEGR